ncbi:MAG: CRISPR-associated endonuclease Cas1 [Dysgonamonadaceae bacterium]|jgi:CRISPR-associated protein Cas1|nr:CRISPR-associated endonuclease Cas1 [Dysgonamonadaceae bacterium]
MDIILNSFGACLTKDNDCFMVLHKDGKQRIPPADVRTISVSKGTSISSDAVLLAIDNEIEVLFVDNQGKPQGRIWSSKYGSISTIRKGQLVFSQSNEAVDWIKDIIRQKIENQQALLFTFGVQFPDSQNTIRHNVNRMEKYREKVTGLSGETVSEVASQLRGYEGVASKIYFETMNLFLPEEYRFSQRSQHPAADIVNALLNYGYGMLYGKIEGALIYAGIDPYIGILHRDEYNRPVLVYDVIERYRVWVDYVVYMLVEQRIVSEEQYSVKTDGSVWLENLGRRIIIQSLNDYLAEIIPIKGLERSRSTHIDLYCQNLAQKFKKLC